MIIKHYKQNGHDPKSTEFDHIHPLLDHRLSNVGMSYKGLKNGEYIVQVLYVISS